MNPASWNGFLSAFVRVVRERTSAALSDFVRSAELIIYSHLEHTHGEMVYNIAPVLLLRKLVPAPSIRLLQLVLK